MTERRDLNNELILMKKTIQQAKVCVIRKLIRKLKICKESHEKKPNPLMLTGKVTKLTDQINYLKKTPNLKLANLVLTFDKNPTKILTNNLSSFEDLSIAHIATFEAIRTKINELKTKFSLDDDNEDWRKNLNEVGKKKKKKMKKEILIKRKTDRKEINKKVNEITKKREEWLVENINTEHNENIFKAFDDKADDSVELTEMAEEKKKKQKTPKHHKNHSNLEDCISEPLQKRNKSAPNKTADPFFITESGQNYLATAVISRTQPDGPNDGLGRKERRAQHFGKKPKTISKPNDKSFKTSTSARFSEDKSNTVTDKIHPSWAAKMKTKGINKFQGKKMKFGDTETPGSVGNCSISEKVTDSEKLHPSWVAKQKLKPVISEFKGNKIVFND